MKRFAWMALVGLAAFAPPLALAAYDGPGQLTYDQTQNGIRVVFTAQAKVARGGYSRFTISAEVPIEAGSQGQSVVLEIRKSINDAVIGTCSFTPTAADVGKTVVYDCGELFELITGIPAAATSVDVYPYVLRNGVLLEHNGNANKLTLAIVDDDAFEPNDTSLVATPLTVALGAPATWTDLVSRDKDVFKFVAPAGVASVEVIIEFWTGANDLDLYLDDDIPLGPGDSDKAIISVTPGQTYYFQVQGAFAFSPAFYDLRLIAYDTDHEISVTTPPKGTPDPVASGGQVSFSLEASDTLQHALGYSWIARCTWSATAGQWANRNTDSPTWTAPVNNTGSQQVCRITVSAEDEFGLSWSSVLDQRVGPAPHTADDHSRSQRHAKPRVSQQRGGVERDGRR